MSTKSTVEATAFINVQVIAIPHTDPDGKVVYETTFSPESIYVTESDTVINYQLIEPTPEGVQFIGMTIKPKHTHQLSHPSLSKSGKLITFSDANTVKETLSVTLHFIDKDDVQFKVDPEVVNEPR